LLRNAAMKELDELIQAGQAAGSMRLFSVRHEFPSEWHRFKTHTPPNNQRHELALTLRPEHYPFWSQARLAQGSVTRMDLLARSEQNSVEVVDKPDQNENAAREGYAGEGCCSGQSAHRQIGQDPTTRQADRRIQALLR
jgi:hypothetical protein